MTAAHHTTTRARRFAPTAQPFASTDESDPTVTVTVRVTLHGDDAPAAAAQFVTALRAVTDGAIADSTITISAPDRANARRWSELDRRSLIAAAPPAPTSSELEIYADERVATLGGEQLTLSRREYDLLLFLAQNPRRVFTRAQLLQSVWEYDFPSGGRTVDVHVRRLRVKLDGRGPAIATVRGVGYRLDEPERVRVLPG